MVTDGRIAHIAKDAIYAPPAIFDEEHSEREERWVSLGKDRRGSVLILIHTFLEVSAGECKIRIISARKANKREARQYEEI